MALYLRNGIWQIDLRAHEGKRFSTKLKKEDKALAQTMYDAEKAKLILGFNNPKPNVLTLKDALEKLRNDPTTTHDVQKGFNSAKDQLIGFYGASKELHEIDEQSMDDFITWSRKTKKLSDSTINRKLAVLSKLLKFGKKKWKVVQEVPEIPWLDEPAGRIRWISKEEEQEIVNYFETTVRVNFPGNKYPIMAKLVPFLIDTGMRLGEALKLNYREIDFTNNVIHIWTNKSDKPRTIPMTRRVIKVLTDLKLNPKPFGELSHYSADKAFSLMRECLGKGDDTLLVLHACRHTCATRLLESTGDLKLVQEWLGHRSIRSTMVYAHITPKALLKGVEALQSHDQPNVTL